MSLLGNGTLANAGAPYYSGGGGSAGPNPVVSTLTLPAGGAIVMTQVLTINDPETTAVTQDFYFATNDTNPPLSSFMTSTMNDFIVNGPDGGVGNGQLLLAAGNDGRCAIWCNNAANVNSTLAIVADNVIIPSNVEVSSIGTSNPLTTNLAFVGVSTNNISLDMTSTSLLQVLFDNPPAPYGAIGYRDGIMTVGGSVGGVELPVSISSLTVSTINGGVPAITSLFSTLFGANPSLSTIPF